jgi:hypothetical protein
LIVVVVLSIKTMTHQQAPFNLINKAMYTLNFSSIKKKSALLMLAMIGGLFCLDVFAGGNASKPKAPYNPLLDAVKAGNIEGIKKSMTEGYQIEIPMANGLTYLMVAVQNNHLEVVKYLIENTGIDPHAQDAQGCNALHHAVMMSGEIDLLSIVDYLVNTVGMSASTENHAGESPISIIKSKILAMEGNSDDFIVSSALSNQDQVTLEKLKAIFSKLIEPSVEGNQQSWSVSSLICCCFSGTSSCLSKTSHCLVRSACHLWVLMQFGSNKRKTS